MKYAVIQTGGKQYKVAEGETITVEKLQTTPESQFVFDQVLLLVNGSTHVGQPYVAGATVSAKVLDHVKGEKIRVAKFKAKARYRRITGHRQQLTKLLIEKIESKVKKATSTEAEEK